MDARLECRGKPAKNSTAPIRVIAVKLLKDEAWRPQELICNIADKMRLRHRSPPSDLESRIARLRRRRDGHSTEAS
jgi:hypothetical protein